MFPLGFLCVLILFSGCVAENVEIAPTSTNLSPAYTTPEASKACPGSCPTFSTPAPGWCAGETVSGGVDGCGCDMPPRCVNSSVECTSDLDCAAGGCSGQVCTTKAKAGDLVTTCEWMPEYECYRLTSCGCVDGRCRWRSNPRFDLCIAGGGSMTPTPGCLNLTDDECRDKIREEAKVNMRAGIASRTLSGVV